MIIKQINTRWWHTLNGFMRNTMVRSAPGYGPPKIVLTEYPRSGGTWVGHIIADYLAIPFPRNRLPPPRRRCLLHGHYLRSSRANDTIVMWRDGRDIMVSFYYFILFENFLPSSTQAIEDRTYSYNKGRQADTYRKRLGIKDASDVRRYLPRLIEDLFTRGPPQKAWIRPNNITWSSFADTWRNQTGHMEISYEAMSENPRSALAKILPSLSGREVDETKLDSCIAKFSFENTTNRKRGVEDVHNSIRKGIVGDWKNTFTREAREVFDYYAGQTLLDLEYEADRSWVDT